MGARRLALLIALLVATRVLLVACAAEVFYFGEECGKGVAAKAMIDRLPVEHWKLVYVWHEGGGFVVTHLKALAFLAVGESLLAHKLVAIATSTILLVVGVTFARECFSERAAFLFGLLVVFCPDSYLRFSLMDLGTHFEATIFIALVLRYAFRILRAREPAAGDWVKLGLASGFGLYFSLQVAPAVLCAATYLVVGLKRRLVSRGLAIGVASSFVGAAPLLYMLSKVGLDAVRVRGQDAISSKGTSFLESLHDLFEPIVREGNALDWIVLVLVPAVIAIGFVKHRERAFVLPALGIAVYCTQFLALYFFSGLAVGMAGHWGIYLRTSALWFFATMLAAAAIDRLLDSKPTLAVGALVLLLVAGVADFVSVARTGDPAHPLENLALVARTKGVDYVEYFDKFVSHLDGDESAKARVMLHLRDESDLLPSSIAHSLFEKSDAPLLEVLARMRAGFGERFEEGLLGLGASLHPGEGYDFDVAYGSLEAAPRELQPLLAEAIGRAGVGPRFRRDRLVEQIELAVPERWRHAWLRGAGWRVYMAYRLAPRDAEHFLESCAPLDQPALRAGYRAALASNTLP